MNRFAGFVALLSCVVLTAVSCTEQTPDAQTFSPTAAEIRSIRTNLNYLTDDEREGRGVGTHGLDEAADYLAVHFAALKLQPLPRLDGYFQNFAMKAGTTIDGEKTSLAVDGRTLALGSDYLPAGNSGAGSFDVSIRDAQNSAGSFALHDVPPTTRPDVNAYVRAADAKTSAVFVAVDRLPAQVDATRRLRLPVYFVTRDAADALRHPATTQAAVVHVKGTVATTRRSVPVRNIVGVLPGKNRDEYVVVGAHYDHLGRGALGGALFGTGQIFHGADDNASGTSALLDVAEKLSHGPTPARSILFCLFTGEEEGLVGSDYFVAHPPVSTGQIVAMLNLDMVGRVRDDTLFIGGAGTAAQFVPLLDEVSNDLPLHIAHIGRGGFGPSDHASFSRERIPVMFFFSGLHAQYHTPRDTADTVNVVGIADTAELVRRLALRLAETPRQVYFAGFDNEPALASSDPHPPGVGGATPPTHASRRVTLGVMPDYNLEDERGVAIASVIPNTPAEKAGLRAGDVITTVAGKKMATVDDLQELLAKTAPETTSEVEVIRGGSTVRCSVTFLAPTTRP